MDYVDGIPALAGDDALNDVPHYTDEMRAALIGPGGLLEDTGWIDLDLAADATLYGTDLTQVRRVGPVVNLIGVVSPATQDAADRLSGVTGSMEIGQLPEECIPAQNRVTIMQGSALNRWTLNIRDSGLVDATRYDGTADTSTWLPFSATWLVN